MYARSQLSTTTIKQEKIRKMKEISTYLFFPVQVLQLNSFQTFMVIDMEWISVPFASRLEVDEDIVIVFAI